MHWIIARFRTGKCPKCAGSAHSGYYSGAARDSMAANDQFAARVPDDAWVGCGNAHGDWRGANPDTG